MDGFTVSALDFLGTVFQCEDYIGRRGSLGISSASLGFVVTACKSMSKKRETERKNLKLSLWLFSYCTGEKLKEKEVREINENEILVIFLLKHANLLLT